MHKIANMISERYQYRHAIKLYNVQDDPYGLVNLAHDKTYEELMNLHDTKLPAWMQSQKDRPGY